MLFLVTLVHRCSALGMQSCVRRVSSSVDMHHIDSWGWGANGTYVLQVPQSSPVNLRCLHM
jgi:hypothetical protein